MVSDYTIPARKVLAALAARKACLEAATSANGYLTDYWKSVVEEIDNEEVGEHSLLQSWVKDKTGKRCRLAKVIHDAYMDSLHGWLFVFDSRLDLDGKHKWLVDEVRAAS